MLTLRSIAGQGGGDCQTGWASCDSTCRGSVPTCPCPQPLTPENTFFPSKQVTGKSTDDSASRVCHIMSQDWVPLTIFYPLITTHRIYCALCGHRDSWFNVFGFAFYEKAKFGLPSDKVTVEFSASCQEQTLKKSWVCSALKCEQSIVVDKSWFILWPKGFTSALLINAQPGHTKKPLAMRVVLRRLLWRLSNMPGVWSVVCEAVLPTLGRACSMTAATYCTLTCLVSIVKIISSEGGKMI